MTSPSPTEFLKKVLTNRTSGSSTYDDDSYYYDDDYYDDYSQQEEEQEALLMLALIVSGIGLCTNAMGLLCIKFLSNRKRECSGARIRLLVSLGAADMVICLSLFVRDLTMPTLDPDGDYCWKVLLNGLLPTAQVICLLNLLGMAIDHYLAILNPLRYDQLMNKRRATIMIAFFWITTLVLAFAEFASGMKYDPSNAANVTYCQYVHTSPSYDPEYALMVIAFICLVGMSYIYSRIYDEIRHIARRGPPNQNFNEVRRGLITTWLILGSFLVCWLPFFIAHVTIILMASLTKLGYPVDENAFLALIDSNVLEWLVPLFMLNTILDPAIYMLHLVNVKKLCLFTRRRGSYFDTSDETRKTTCGGLEHQTLTSEHRPLKPGEDVHYV